MNKHNLEERLIDFAVKITEIAETMPDSKAASHLAGQLLRSGTSPALNYGEAQSVLTAQKNIQKQASNLRQKS
jgi:four helix bundle protein